MSISISGDGSITGVSTSYTFDKSVSIAGTVSYEDVTSIDAVGIITAQSGIHIDDSIVHLGDTNTKIRFPAADTFSVETAGSEAIRIDSSGRLLLGTTTEGNSSADNFTIADSTHCGITLRSGTSSRGAVYFSDATSGNDEFDGYVIYEHDNRALRFATAATERLRIDSSGNLFFGGSSNSTAKVKLTNATDGGGIYVRAPGNQPTWKAFQVIDNTDSDTDVIQLYSTGNAYFAGDVGIGDNAPNSNYGTNLSVHSTATDGARLKISDGTTGKGNTDGLDIISTGGAAYIMNRYAGAMHLATNNTNRVNITSAGVVGINKSSPSSDAQLDVVGSSYWPILVKTTSAGGGGVAIKDKDDVTSLYTGSGGSAWLTGSAITDGLIRAQNNLLFATNGNNERLRITSSGNVNFYGGTIGFENSGGTVLQVVQSGVAYKQLDLRASDMIFATGAGSATERMRISSAGYVTKPNHPCFSVWNNAGSSSAFSAMSVANWTVAHVNNGNHFDLSNNKFVCPVAGNYFFSCMMLSNSNTRLFFNIRKNGVDINGTYIETIGSSSGNFQTGTMTVVLTAAANDDFQIYVRNNAGYGSSYANFNGFLLG